MHRVIQVQQQDFELAEHYEMIRQHCGEAVGAIAAFVGLVRDHNSHAGDGGTVGSLALEHYPGMTESSICQIVDEAEQRWPLLAVTVIELGSYSRRIKSCLWWLQVPTAAQPLLRPSSLWTT